MIADEQENMIFKEDAHKEILRIHAVLKKARQYINSKSA